MININWKTKEKSEIKSEKLTGEEKKRREIRREIERN
jgi:hypothetical protein